MYYFSVDTETTGKDPKKDQILEFAIIFENTNNSPLSFKTIPKKSFILDHPKIEGDAFALNMNKRLLKILSEYHSLTGNEKEEFRRKHNIIKPKELYGKVVLFIAKCLNLTANDIPNTPINLAGKNIALFDLPFMEKIMNLKTGLCISRRLLDPAILFMRHEDKYLPDLALCKERAGIPSPEKHIALNDAWDIVRLIRIGNEKLNK